MYTESFYHIGGLKVRIAGGRTVHAIGRLAGFDRFGAAASGDADITIETDLEFDANPPDASLIHEFTVLDMDHRLSSFGGGYIFEMRRCDGTPAAAVRYDPRTERVTMSGCQYDLALKYAVWVAYSFAATGKGVIPIHASSVVKDGRAVLFLGESGTGKSTHSRLWIGHIDGAYLLNDDSPLLRVSDGVIVACGSPWSGKVHCYHHEIHPVKAMVRLRKAPGNRIRLTNRLDSIGAVYPSCPPLFAYDNELVGRILRAVDRIVSSVPVYIMECRPDGDAAKMAYGSIYGVK